MTTDLVTRAQWGARPPKSVSTNIAPEGITVHYEGGATLAGDHSKCASIVRSIQAYHMDTQGWSDIAYTSLVCMHGVRFEGRGPGVRTSASGANEANTRSYAVCVMAGVDDPLTDGAKWAMLDEATRLGKPIRWGHLDWYATACPGVPIYDWVHDGAPAPGTSPPGPQPPPILPPGGPTVSDFAQAENVEGRIEMVSLDPKGGVSHRYQARPRDPGSFTDWAPLGAGGTHPPFSSVAMSRQDGDKPEARNLLVSGKASPFGEVYECWQTITATPAGLVFGWSDWVKV